MKDQINKLTEAQAKELLKLAMKYLELAVYAESHYDKMTAAENLGFLSNEIELFAKSNEEQ
jgi:hypothetical protein